MSRQSENFRFGISLKLSLGRSYDEGMEYVFSMGDQLGGYTYLFSIISRLNLFFSFIPAALTITLIA